jgi:hypothetical protein
MIKIGVDEEVFEILKIMLFHLRTTLRMMYLEDCYACQLQYIR